jgi:uncharacterized protein (DUF433 family)
MRIRVADVLQLLASGLTPAAIVEELPDLHVEDVYASILYAAQQIDHTILAA